ncbi:Uu.00g039560.m01.CDS01 [Anthostomella pinea]|uniref:Uu.00g039560.m01.CDS01 n=1 Tax=Anthostomella pinea TaxID=933095 RepID=A0AAI8VA52_9PEZI|nr:Uu.00g039560.m01.CDS01 [Anthostomella pinea]
MERKDDKRKKSVQAFPGFNTQHRCNNFDAILCWASDLQAPPGDELPEDFTRIPAGEDIIPSGI